MGKQRYEREIEEILSKYEQEKAQRDKQPRPEKPPPIDFRAGGQHSRLPSKSPGTPNMPNWKRLSSGQYMLASFGVVLLALLVSRFALPLAQILVIVAVVLFLVPILLYRTTGTSSGGYSPREEKRWRGQVIDFNTRRNVTDDPFEKIKRWFQRR
ncbi:MAG TPA: hypothetical protein VEX13_10970 [Chloroflexia bacterium]|nr:hypothetical protein [Chloroflexia bacterium]